MNERKKNGFSLEGLESELRQMPQPQAPAELESRLLADIPALKPRQHLWYRVPLLRAAAAAVVVTGVVGLLAWLTGGNGGASVAWGNVAQRIKQVNHVHFYEITKFCLFSIFEDPLDQPFAEPGRLRFFCFMCHSLFPGWRWKCSPRSIVPGL